MSAAPLYPGKAGECFKNVIMDSIHRDGSKVVHGVIRNAEGRRLDHAWVELGGKVFDPTQGVVMSRGRWYALTKAKVEVKYDAREAMQKGIAARHWGPWHK